MIFESGKYTAQIRKIYVKTYERKADGAKFKRLVLDLDVVNDKREIKQLKATYALDYAKEYFNEYCGKSSDELIGMCGEAVLTVKSFVNDKGETIKYNDVKYFNLYDENNNPIIYRKKEADNEDVVEKIGW